MGGLVLRRGRGCGGERIAIKGFHDSVEEGGRGGRALLWDLRAGGDREA